MMKPKMTSSKKKPWTAGIALLSVLLFASCTQDEVSGGNNDDRPATLALSTVKATDIDVKQVATRAVTTTDYPTTDSIGFFVKADAANGYVACDNRKGKYSTARQLWLPVDSIWLNKHDADIAIYAPYDAAHTTPATLTLTAALRPVDGSKDIWCKHITANNTSKSPAVTLEHVYSRLYLTVTRDATYKADASLTALDVKGDEVYESTTYKPFETAPYTYGTTKGLTPTVTAQTLSASTVSATYDLLLIPTPLTGDITLTLTVDGKKMETVIEKTRFTGSKLDAGKQYNVDLALKPGKLDITSVSVVKWDALPEINGGQAEFEPFGIQVPSDQITLGTQCTDADKTLLSTLTWANGNLRVAGDGTNAEEESIWDESTGYGYYYTWNAFYGGKGNTAYGTGDPCTKLASKYGEGWRTPTSGEFGSLARCSSTKLVEHEGVKGMWFMNSNTGLFLPAAGSSVSPEGSNTKPSHHKNNKGFYWCNNLYGADGFVLVVEDNPSVTYYKTSFGLSVRCVKSAK